MKWLDDFSFFSADFTFHYNNLNKKLQGNASVLSSMFGHFKAFERKLEIFS